MRLPRMKPWSWTLLIVGLIAADGFAVGLGGPSTAHLFLLAWAGGRSRNRPDPPSRRLGCLGRWALDALRPPGIVRNGRIDLRGVAPFCPDRPHSVSTCTVAYLRPLGRRLSAPVRSVQFRVRTALVALAIFGLYLGWEIHAWRTWRLRNDYLRQAAQSAMGVKGDLSTLRSLREEPAEFRGRPPSDSNARRALLRSIAAQAAGVAAKELKKHEVDVQLAKLVHNTNRKQKYERAAAEPWKPVPPDRPMPEPKPEADDGLRLREYRRALADYDQLARTYPDLVEAHSRSAWLRATCPDARCRDGKLAVASATRACELTNWNDADELEVLAAACRRGR